MREKFEKLKKEMSQLQEKQKEILGCGKLSALSEEQQLIYCRNNKALGILSYEAYQLLKEENDTNQAVIYFEIAFQLGFQKAIVEIKNARQKLAQQTINAKEYLNLSADELNTLALCHLLGVGVEQNMANALVLFQYSAPKGHTRSQYNLGFMYSKGSGVKKDGKKAVHWYRLAAEQGHALGQCNLGVMYGNGFGVKKDGKKAVHWYRLAAEQGDALGQCNLGVMYENGCGVEEDKAEAVHWYRLAAEQGYALGQCNLGVMYGNGFGVKADKAEAVKWYRLAAEQGYARGQCNLGAMYDYGFGIKEDKKKAARLYRQSAEQENNKARTHLSNASKKHPIMAFHLAMLEADGDKIQSLIKETPALIEELTWDLKRAPGNTALQHILASVITPLLSATPWQDNLCLSLYRLLEHSGEAIEDSERFRLRVISHEQISRYLKNALPSGDTLSEVLSQMDMIIHLWYFSKDIDDLSQHRAFTLLAANQLKNRLYYMESKNLSLEGANESSHFLRQAALILIKAYFGELFEVNLLHPPSFNQLLFFLAMHQFNPEITVQEMNEFLKIELIKPVQFTHYIDLLHRLTCYLNREEVTRDSPALSALKNKLINEWESIQDPSEQQAMEILTGLCTESNKALAGTQKVSNGLFAVKDKTANKLYTYLAKQAFQELYEALSENPAINQPII